MTLVMGMDQHREQITAEWIDTITGEISRARIALADRIAVRTFLARFDGAGLEVALEATTGWRFLVEELQRAGAERHLAESAETSGLKGKKRRAKTDWADARHLRELLLIGRLPESWIAPAHLLDLRARVRCRHTLVHQRTEWQQRMHSVLYHHGVPRARKLLTLANRERIAAIKLPAAAREQLTIALEMIDAIEVQIGPVDLALRAYARKQPGCRALIDQIYGLGPLTSVTLLAELGDTRRFRTPATQFATPGWTSPSINQISTASPGACPGRDHQHCAGRCMKPRKRRGARVAPTGPITNSSPSDSAATARVSRSRASC